ncbi:MAG TPA: TonB-dependent receptor [Chitinophagales bacterium]|nr:TonB-dependent receptor [Chitinophagales bacterium]
MRLYTFIILIFLGTQLTFAQAPTGNIYGSVVDIDDKAPLEYGTILLRNNKTQSTTGGLTDEKGRFNISNIPLGTYFLEISYIGYNSYIQKEFKIQPSTLSRNLGEIKLSQNASQLDVVEVIGEKSMFQLGGEKKIFNVDKNAISAGGNAMDAMKQIPTLDVTMDGNITLRGSENIIIYINGKPSGMTADSKQAILESLPANSIESIELITNPSSKYDADGTAGIINIVLKKNFNRGLNGVANIGYSTKYKNNAGFSLNFKKNRINFTSSYNYRFHQSYNKGTNNRNNLFDGYSNFINSTSESDYKRISGNINLGLDIEMTDKATISFGNIITADGGPNGELNYTDFLDFEEVYYGGFARIRDGKRKGINNNSSFNYAQKLKNNGQKLNLSANLVTGKSINDKNYMQSNFDEYEFPIELLPQQEFNKNIGKNFSSTVQVDYTHPFKKHGELEAGYKFSYRQLFSDFYADSLDRSTQETVYNANLSNSFIYDEFVNAAYLTYGGKVKDFSYKLGVRSEQSNISIENNQVDNRFKNNYIDFFPSLFLSQKIKSHEIQGSYTYRINRPNPWMLNPFADYDNPLSIRKGNPYLKPEYIHSVELNYLKNWKSTFLTASVYYRNSKNNFTRAREVNPETSVATMYWDNLDQSQNIGTEIIFRTPITKWWSFMINGNVYYNKVQGKIPGDDNDNSTNSFQWNTRAMTNFKFWKNTELQLSYRFNSRMEYLQGYILPMQSLDIGLKKDFLKNNKASIALNVQDIFNTRKFSVFNSGVNYASDATWKWESRVFTINFSYRFGKQETTPRKRGGENNMMDGGNQMMDF